MTIDTHAPAITPTPDEPIEDVIALDLAGLSWICDDETGYWVNDFSPVSPLTWDELVGLHRLPPQVYLRHYPGEVVYSREILDRVAAIADDYERSARPLAAPTWVEEIRAALRGVA